MASVMEGGVLVRRGGVVESSHLVHAAVVGPDGELMGWVGNPGRVTYLRSAAKPFQALPLVEDGVVASLGLTGAELAVVCASHNGAAEHLREVEHILQRIGVGAGSLACGPHTPMGVEAARGLRARGEEPDRIHNNCSGKHAGMLALARHHGWELKGYHLPDHPVQRRMALEVARWCRVPVAELGVGVDGCGVSCFSLPLSTMALGFAAFARSASAGEAPTVLVKAMTAHPALVAGTGRLCTRLMELAGDRVFAKVGAEGVYCGALRDGSAGVALKVEDGARRAADAALLRILQLLGVLTEGEMEELAGFAHPPILNTRGEVVGGLQAAFGLEWLS